ncbi:MAG: dynamin family protein, partial [Selenomonadaceae bacterium]|nr:dynamin family protein [Selenomonadaceae bacterium]
MDFQNKDNEQKYQADVQHINDLINGSIDAQRYAWDATAQQCAVRIEQIKNLINDKVFDDSSEGNGEQQDIIKLSKDLSAFLERCASPEFQVALVGTIKAGKSTLINALLNYELASTRVTPETAALTKFKKADEDFVQISFYTDQEWAALWKSATSATNTVFVEDYNKLNADAEKSRWLNQPTQTMHFNDREELKQEIERRTSSQHPEHYFVKEVVVGLKDFDLPDGVVLIDTPGLNDVVTFRSDITRGYIARANAVFMCVKGDSLTGEELQTLQRVFTNTKGKINKVYVIATQLDTLNNPKSDWEKQKVEWTKYLKGDNCFKSEALVQSNLVPVTAYLFTLLEKYKDNRLTEDEEEFTLRPLLGKFRIRARELNARFAELEEFTNIRPLFHKLQTEVVAKHKEDLIDDIIKTYDSHVEEIKKLMAAKKTAQQQLIEDSKKSLDQIQAERDQRVKELE